MAVDVYVLYKIIKLASDLKPMLLFSRLLPVRWLITQFSASSNSWSFTAFQHVLWKVQKIGEQAQRSLGNGIFKLMTNMTFLDFYFKQYLCFLLPQSYLTATLTPIFHVHWGSSVRTQLLSLTRRLLPQWTPVLNMCCSFSVFQSS